MFPVVSSDPDPKGQNGSGHKHAQSVSGISNAKKSHADTDRDESYLVKNFVGQISREYLLSLLYHGSRSLERGAPNSIQSTVDSPSRFRLRPQDYPKGMFKVTKPLPGEFPPALSFDKIHRTWPRFPPLDKIKLNSEQKDMYVRTFIPSVFILFNFSFFIMCVFRQFLLYVFAQ